MQSNGQGTFWGSVKRLKQCVGVLQRFSGWLANYVLRMLENWVHALLEFKLLNLRSSSSPFIRANFKVMPLAYSTDLRWRVVWLHIAHNLKVSDIAEQLCLSESSVRRYIDLFQQTGDATPCSQWHGPPKLLGEFEQVLLLRLIINNPGIYLHA